MEALPLLGKRRAMHLSPTGKVPRPHTPTRDSYDAWHDLRSGGLSTIGPWCVGMLGNKGPAGGPRDDAMTCLDDVIGGGGRRGIGPLSLRQYDILLPRGRGGPQPGVGLLLVNQIAVSVISQHFPSGGRRKISEPPHYGEPTGGWKGPQ